MTPSPPKGALSTTAALALLFCGGGGALGNDCR